jgi:hypothetical protein
MKEGILMKKYSLAVRLADAKEAALDIFWLSIVVLSIAAIFSYYFPQLWFPPLNSLNSAVAALEAILTATGLIFLVSFLVPSAEEPIEEAC